MQIRFFLLALLALPAATASAQVAIDGRSYNGAGYNPIRYGQYSNDSYFSQQSYWYARTHPFPTYVPYRGYLGYAYRRAPRPIDVSGYQQWASSQQLNNTLESAVQRGANATDAQQRVLGVSPANIPTQPNLNQPESQGEAQTATLRIPPFRAPSTQPVPGPGQTVVKQAPAQPAGLTQLTGALADLRTIRYQNDPKPHMVAQLENAEGWRFLTDLGPLDQLSTFNGNRGTQLNIIGHGGQINGERALFAQIINLPDQSISVRNNFPPEKQADQQAPAPKPERSPGEADQAQPSELQTGQEKK